MSSLCISYFDLLRLPSIFSFFFFNDTATTEIYTLSLHDALPILPFDYVWRTGANAATQFTTSTPIRLAGMQIPAATYTDRKSTRLNSSHQIISYAVFCLKKKKKRINKLQNHTHLH